MLIKLSKANKLAFAIILGFSVFFFAAIFSRLNVDVHHQGIMLSAAMRVFDGDPLYVGNSYYYGPLVPILNSLGIYIFGKHLLVLQLMASGCYGFIAILLWRIWSRFLPDLISGITVVLSFLLAPFLYWEFHPWSSIYSLFFLLLSLYFIIRWIETNNCYSLLFVGISAALAFWSRQTVGLLLILALLSIIIFFTTSLFEKKSPKLKSIIFFLLGLMPLLIIGFFILFINNSLLAWFYSSFTSRIDWAINISGEGAGLNKIISTIILCLFALFRPNIWLFLPVVMLLEFIEIIFKVILDKRKIKKEFAIYIAFLTLCCTSWLQYYPVSDPRHHFWSALPMYGIPIIFLWRIFGQKINSIHEIPLSNLIKPIRNLWFGMGCLILICFSLTYLIELKQRLISGVKFDDSLNLLPAWQRLALYDTPFINPPILRGMLGTKSQVDSLSRLNDGFNKYISDNSSVILQSNSSWDFIAPYYLDHVQADNSSRLIISDTLIQTEGYQLLMHETIAPSFAYQLSQPGNYYIYSPIDYISSKIIAEYYLTEPNYILSKDLENFPSKVPLAMIQIDFKEIVKLDAVSITSEGLGGGSWTTKPINHLWGVGIKDQLLNDKIINYGPRKELLNLNVNRKLILLIPDNGNLINCPKLKILFKLDNKKDLGTIASCRNIVK
jgi:hypothetical protein